MKLGMTLSPLLFFIVVATLLISTGCQKRVQNTCYTGIIRVEKIGYGCSPIIEVTKGPSGGLPVPTSITFSPDLFEEKYGRDPVVGDIVHFEVLGFSKITDFRNANCLWASYSAQIQYCQ